MAKKTIAPASKPQELFLTIRDNDNGADGFGEEVDIVFYGGQAGGGKSFASLLHHLKYAHDPLYRGLTLRRTTPMLLKPGAIWDDAKSLYREYDPNCQIKIKDLKFIMKSKAEISFSHFERVDDTNNFQGSQISSVVFDELCHFEESQFLYILSRLRTKANMKPVARATMNPDPDSWVRKWVDWYLYPKGHELFGRPDPSKQGVIRWFVRLNNDMVWGDTKQELLDKYPKSTPLSFAAIFASVHDNPYIEKSYIAFLEGLPRIEREILLYGNWEARAESSGYFKRHYVEPELTVAPCNKEFVRVCRAYDLAGSVVSELNPAPDFSAAVKMGLLKNGEYVILDVVRWRSRFGEVEKKILELAAEDGPRVDIIIPRDPGQAGMAAAKMLAKTITGAGYYVRMKPASKSKLDRYRPFSAAAENGLIHIVRNCCDDLENKVYNDNSFYYSEMEAFTGARKGFDDMCDATADAFEYLATSKKIPVGFKLPSFTQSNPFALD